MSLSLARPVDDVFEDENEVVKRDMTNDKEDLLVIVVVKGLNGFGEDKVDDFEGIEAILPNYSRNTLPCLLIRVLL